MVIPPKLKRKAIALATILLVGAIVLYDPSSGGDESWEWDPTGDVEYRALTEESGAAVEEEQQPEIDLSKGWGFEDDSVEHLPHYYLEGMNQFAGLGHSFMAFNNLVTLARQNNLMPRFVFQTSGHDLNSENVHTYFFGDEFMSNVPSDMECEKVTASPESIPQLISDAESKGEGCKIFSLREQVGPQKAWVSIGTNLPLLRKLFQMNDHQDTMVREDPLQEDLATVAVHIRRGDLFSYLKHGSHREQAGMRLVTESAYISVLKQLFSKLEAHGKKNINLVLYCEGMKASSTIETVYGTFDDISKEFSFDNAELKVNWSAGSDHTLQAFDDMCHSDILITGTSGFSYVVSILCSKPVVLAIPFWLPYDDIPNAIELDVERSNYSLPHLNIHDPVSLIDEAKFDETKFDSLFSTMISAEVD